MMSTCSKARLQSWGNYSDSFRNGLLQALQVLNEGLIYFHNLAYIKQEVSLTFPSAPIIQTVMSMFAQSCLIYNCLHLVICS